MKQNAIQQPKCKTGKKSLRRFKPKMDKLIPALVLIGLMFSPIIAMAQDAYNYTPTQEQEQAMQEIEGKFLGIYWFIRNIITVVAVIAIAYAGLKFMTSGDDPIKRNESKNLMMAIIVGVIIVWAAGYIIQAMGV